MQDCKRLTGVDLIGCQSVKLLLPNDFLSCVRSWNLLEFEFLSCVRIWVFEFSHNLSFWVWPQFEFFLSQFEFLSFVAIWVFKFCCYSSVVPNFKFLEFCHRLSFLVVKIKLLNLVANWFKSFVKIGVKFGVNFSFWVLSQFRFVSFVPISVFEFCHILSFVIMWVF